MAVEFALIVPVLLLIVFGIINFGVLFSQQLTLNNAVREGARKAVVNEVSTNRQCGGAKAKGSWATFATRPKALPSIRV